MTPRNKDTTQEPWREAYEKWWFEDITDKTPAEGDGNLYTKLSRASFKAGWTARDRASWDETGWVDPSGNLQDAACYACGASLELRCPSCGGASWDDAAVERREAIRRTIQDFPREHGLDYGKLADAIIAALNALPPPREIQSVEPPPNPSEGSEPPQPLSLEARRASQYDRIELDGDDLDEIVLYGVAHLEQMASNAWFLGLTRPDGTGYGVWFDTARVRINVHYEERSGPPLSRWDSGCESADNAGEAGDGSTNKMDALPPPPTGDWRDIESYDDWGSWVLLYSPKWPITCYPLVGWRDGPGEEWQFLARPQWSAEMPWPTKWLPLPPPPKASGT